MANAIVPKHSDVDGKAPLIGDLLLGELALNNFDGKLYAKINDGIDTIIEIGGIEGTASSDSNMDGGRADTIYTLTELAYDGGGA